MSDLQPIARLEMGQFSEKYEDLPVKEATKTHVDGKMYRSDKHPDHVFVYRAARSDFDCFVRG